MFPLRSTLLMLVLGTLGAGLSVAVLLMIPTDAAPADYGRSIAEQLPVLVFVGGAGFGMGILVAVVWSIAQRFFATHVPRA